MNRIVLTAAVLCGAAALAACSKGGSKNQQMAPSAKTTTPSAATMMHQATAGAPGAMTGKSMPTPASTTGAMPMSAPQPQTTESPKPDTDG